MMQRKCSILTTLILVVGVVTVCRIVFEVNQSIKLGQTHTDQIYLKEPWALFKNRCSSPVCTGNASVGNVTWSMVIFVKSSANSFIRREILRRSWASLFRVEEGNITVVFVVGLSGARFTERRLTKESKEHGDILQFNGPDDYRNIALKTLAGMEWASLHLPSTFLYSSMDDDFMVDMLKMTKTINKGFELMRKDSWFEFPIICMFRMGVDEKPVRDENGIFKKWFISESLFKWPVFPRYCHGGMYTTSMRIIDQLLRESWSVDSLYLDDVWITGILRQKIGMPDQMVIKPEETVAVHYSGYTQSPNHNVNAFVDAWQQSIDEMVDSSVCQCFR
nr:beta-1,3-galactosyltransferase 5-like [Ciona intestinalis]|eukprot:XP_002126670.1 beta-1,3-galactosyltransferase 5-like [Ciona intestinalis]